MPFIAEHLTASDADLEALACISYAAFNTDYPFMYIRNPSDDSFHKLGQSHKSSPISPAAYAFKAVDTEMGMMIGVVA